MGNINKKEVTNEVIVNFITLYIRFLKDKKIYNLIKNAFNAKRNRRTFICYLSNLPPSSYFSSFDKGWYWDDLRYEMSREELDRFNDEWIKVIQHSPRKKYDYRMFNWDNIYSWKVGEKINNN